MATKQIDMFGAELVLLGRPRRSSRSAKRPSRARPDELAEATERELGSDPLASYRRFANRLGRQVFACGSCRRPAMDAGPCAGCGYPVAVFAG